MGLYWACHECGAPNFLAPASSTEIPDNGTKCEDQEEHSVNNKAGVWRTLRASGADLGYMMSKGG